MKIKILQVNKTASGWISEAMSEYTKRLSNYIPLEIKDIDVNSKKINSKEIQLELESSKLLAQIRPSDYVVLLDENGKTFSSEAFAVWINKKFSGISADLIFIIGGAYGFHESIKKRANEEIALSNMTFTHQMVRVIFLEQLYRALTILKNEPYHHS